MQSNNLTSYLNIEELASAIFQLKNQFPMITRTTNSLKDHLQI